MDRVRIVLTMRMMRSFEESLRRKIKVVIESRERGRIFTVEAKTTAHVASLRETFTCLSEGFICPDTL
jgi:hypothetical protein